MSNTPIQFISSSKPRVVDVGMTSTFDSIHRNATYHKSFDFSNVNVTGSSGFDDHSLRQFHQTRIFIQDFNGMLSNGTVIDDPNATFILSANLPESISYSIGSTWKTPFSSFGSETGNALVQVAGPALEKLLHGAGDLASGIPGIGGIAKSAMDGLGNLAGKASSTVNKATTYQFWGGSDPFSLQLKIPVLDDTATSENGKGINTNLVEALEFLGSLSLPKESFLGFYEPPPSPFKMSIGVNSSSVSSKIKSYGRILVQLGGILLIDNCIITKVAVSYPETKAMIRHSYKPNYLGTKGTDYLSPILAEVTISISTIAALTADTYSNMLWLRRDNSAELSTHFNFAKDNDNIINQNKDNLLKYSKINAERNDTTRFEEMQKLANSLKTKGNIFQGIPE